MTPSDLHQVLRDAAGLRIGVVGDFCLDAYLVLDPRASEPSVETGLPTRPVRFQRYSLGGAGNVAANLRAIGVPQVRVYGVIGCDPFGKEMCTLFEAQGIPTGGLQVQGEQWQTHVYVKPLENNLEQNRFDFGNYNTLRPETAAALLKDLERALPQLHAVVINEQVLQGLHTPLFREAMRSLIARHPETLFLADSRRFSNEFDGAVRKINLHEAARLAGVSGDAAEAVSADAVRQIAERLFERWGRLLFISRGEYGCVLREAAGFHEVPGLLLSGPVDPVGAGDSLLAGIAVGLAAGAPPLAAAELGTFVAGVTLQKLFQTGTASPEEILALGSDPQYRHRPELARYPSGARYHEDSEIEIVTALPGEARFTHCIFDHDGTISTLRQGWEEIMEPMMVGAILGGREKEVDEGFQDRVVAAVRQFIDRTTGIQTIAQMKGLVDLVRHFGCVPASDILTAAAYKERYNSMLLRMVEARMRKLAAGELAVEDFTVKRVIPFLQALHARGIALYLASGTDQTDLRREAEILGYAGLFGDRIVGSVGDITRDAKKVVLEKILSEIGVGTRVVTFGDGPVEMRETAKRGGCAVGVASNEIRRYGLNAGKRRRLIEAGADLIVPDFSQTDRLLRILFPS